MQSSWPTSISPVTLSSRSLQFWCIQNSHSLKKTSNMAHLACSSWLSAPCVLLLGRSRLADSLTPSFWLRVPQYQLLYTSLPLPLTSMKLWQPVPCFMSLAPLSQGTVGCSSVCEQCLYSFSMQDCGLLMGQRKHQRWPSTEEKHKGSSRVPRRECTNTLQGAKPACRCRWIKQLLGDKLFNRTGCAMANVYAWPCQFSWCILPVASGHL